MMKKIIGYTLIILPLLGVLIVVGMVIGFYEILIIFLIAILATISVGIGEKLISDENEKIF